MRAAGWKAKSRGHLTQTEPFSHAQQKRHDSRSMAIHIKSVTLLSYAKSTFTADLGHKRSATSGRISCVAAALRAGPAERQLLESHRRGRTPGEVGFYEDRFVKTGSRSWRHGGTCSRHPFGMGEVDRDRRQGTVRSPSCRPDQLPCRTCEPDTTCSMRARRAGNPQ